jgi:4-hydroxy-tetrahydrodipicolinate reductase
MLFFSLKVPYNHGPVAREVYLARVIVTGVSGRMGSAILRFVRDDDELVLAGATARKGSASVGLDAGLAARLGPMEVEVVEDLARALDNAKPKVDVVIDFTVAEASVQHARLCAERKVALVVGSTGFSSDDKAAVAQAAQQTAIVMAPNMSVGVTLMLRLVAEAAKVLGPAFDAEVVELHHRMKKDAPSGTALRLAEVVADTYGRMGQHQALRTSREGVVGERGRNEVGVQSLRGGDIVGEHTVFFLGEGERLEVTHRATSRDNFAAGAVRAARWVAGKPPGLYDMLDVLSLRT